MSRKPNRLSNGLLANGKRLLMEAALTLTASSRSLNAVSLRELAREAGLNPNTFYRHFKDFDELGLAIIEEMSRELREPLRELRRQAAEAGVPQGTPQVSWQDNPRLNLARARGVNQQTVKLFFDYVAENPNAFILGVRELHGASPVLRKALRQVMQDFAQDMADDIVELGLMPPVDSSQLLGIAETISREMFQLSMDYIEQPESRPGICMKAELMIINLTLGSAMLQGYGALVLEALGNA